MLIVSILELKRSGHDPISWGHNSCASRNSSSEHQLFEINYYFCSEYIDEGWMRENHKKIADGQNINRWLSLARKVWDDIGRRTLCRPRCRPVSNRRPSARHRDPAWSYVQTRYEPLSLLMFRRSSDIILTRATSKSASIRSDDRDSGCTNETGQQAIIDAIKKQALVRSTGAGFRVNWPTHAISCSSLIHRCLIIIAVWTRNKQQTIRGGRDERASSKQTNS